jgi:hypothetical protein
VSTAAKGDQNAARRTAKIITGTYGRLNAPIEQVELRASQPAGRIAP